MRAQALGGAQAPEHGVGELAPLGVVAKERDVAVGGEALRAGLGRVVQQRAEPQPARA